MPGWGRVRTLSALRITGPSSATFTFTLTGSPNTEYDIEGTTNFSSWTDVKTVTTDANGTVEVTDNSAEPYRFYRAVAGQ